MVPDRQALAFGQVAPWMGFDAEGAAAQEAFAALNEAHAFVFILELGGGAVRLREKPAHYPAEEIAGLRPPSHNFLDRAHLYRSFIEAAARAHGFDRPLRLALSVNDSLPFDPAVPIFAFQKRQGGRIVLLPDIEFLRYGFYADPRFTDPFAFAEKSPRAIFVGSTSGRMLTPAAVRERRTARLRAAVHFKGSPRVDFFLPNIVQCATPEAAEAVAALGVAGRRHKWREMFAYRYLLSMDGNGACCSRVALALRSRSVLVKYDSPHRLHYFDRMQPWQHYIPVGSDEDVTRAMDLCALAPGLAERIAEAGGAFFAAWLTREAIADYMVHLLDGYAQACGAQS